MTKFQVDVLKGVAILMVIIIHIGSLVPNIWWYQKTTISYFIISIDQLCRIAMPIFVFFSWYGLTLKYKDVPLKPLSFINSRLSKLLPMYLIWSLAIYLLMVLIPSWRVSFGLPFWTKLLIGQADYQLYFVPIVIIFYLIYIAVIKIPKKIQLLLTLPLYAITLWWFNYLPRFLSAYHYQNLATDTQQYLIPLTWLWYAWLGLVAAQFGSFLDHLPRWFNFILGLLVLAGLYWSITDVFGILNLGSNIIDGLKYTRFSVLVFASCGLIFLVTTARYWQQLNLKRLAFIGTNSFLVYLSHSIYLRLTIYQLLRPIGLIPWLIALSVSLTLTYFSLFPPHLVLRKKIQPRNK